MITEKDFYKQMSGSAAGAIVAVSVGLAVLGFCAVFCGTQLGWKSLLTIVFLVGLGLCFALLIFFIIKAANKKKHPVFKRYGNAAMLAMRINEGMRNPVYFAKPLMGDAPFATLLTDKFIVSGVELTSYMELKDLRTMHVGVIQDVRRIVVGNPVLTAGSLAANYATDKYMQSKGINDQTRFDTLIFKDSDGKEHNYSIQRTEMERVLGTLSQIAPHIQFIP